MHHPISRVPLAVRNIRTYAAPYVLPAGMRYVPAFAPLHPNKQVRSEAVTAGVFRVSLFLFLFPPLKSLIPSPFHRLARKRRSQAPPLPLIIFHPPHLATRSTIPLRAQRQPIQLQMSSPLVLDPRFPWKRHARSSLVPEILYDK